MTDLGFIIKTKKKDLPFTFGYIFDPIHHVAVQVLLLAQTGSEYKKIAELLLMPAVLIKSA